ncbi:MAG: response regulator transcription factor [Dehalococcoidia bacterium]|nr:response regulator transcription factor [Dehalococcoidia bacterium]
MDKTTVLVASEYPRVRSALREIAARENGIVVGEAENATQAVKLAKGLGPDVAILDFGLPYRIGLQEVALSRASGLEASRMILANAPQSRVILVTKVSDEFYQDEATAWGSTIRLTKQTGTGVMPFAIRDLLAGAESSIVFASLAPQGKPLLSERVAWVSLKGTTFGPLLMIAGVCLLFTGVLAPAGVFLGALGVLGLLGGIAGLLVSSLWSKLSRSVR